MEHKKFRIYFVTDEVNGKSFLVKARNKAEAISYMARNHFSCVNVRASEVIFFLESGIRVEDANSD